MQISAHTIVEFRYSMRNGKGEVLEDIMEGSPAVYLHGSGSILPMLETQMEGMMPGDRRQVVVSNEEGFREMDDHFSFEVVIDSVRPATAEEISTGCVQEALLEKDCPPGCIC
jgi:FKBP-type peptidyl-prolyl cis-trans isomerase SlyD